MGKSKNELNALAGEIKMAAERISRYVFKTPLLHSLPLSQATGCEVYLKLESEQKTGAFKVRGAFNKLLLSCGNENATEGFVTASTGNHGLACALAMTTLNIKGLVFVPISISANKESSLKMYDITLEKYATDCVDTECKARATATEMNWTYISPYADLEVIAGQGTIAPEILESLPDVDSVFVTLGGGGLMSGIGTYLKAYHSSVEVVGCSPERAPALMESVKAGKLVNPPFLDTLSSSSNGGLEEGTPTIDICQVVIDKFITVTEKEISQAIYMMLECHHKVIEGAAGVALASFLKQQKDYKNKKVAIVICGANISTQLLQNIIVTESA